MFDSPKLNRSTREPLLELQRRGCIAYIAGGAIRDTVCKRPIRDIDVFIHHFNYQDGPNVQTKWDGFLPGYDTERWLYDVFVKSSQWQCTGLYTVGTIYAAGHSPHIYGPVIEGYINGIKYQFIFTKPHPLKYITNNFDLNLCRAWCDGYKISVSTPFITDWLEHKLTLTGTLSKNEYVYALKHHVPRVKEKYPDHTLVIDPELKAKYDSCQ